MKSPTNHGLPAISVPLLEKIMDQIVRDHADLFQINLTEMRSLDSGWELRVALTSTEENYVKKLIIFTDTEGRIRNTIVERNR